MGYRNKIALLSKEDHAAIRGMTHKQLIKWFQNKKEKPDYTDTYVPMYEISEEIYELGKYCELKFLKEHKQKIFDRPALNREYNGEGEFYIIGKAGLRAIIEDYHQKILKYYKGILEPTAEDLRFGDVTTPEKAIAAKIREWEKNNFGVLPYCLREDSPEVVSSWSYEYQIFELVRLYKTIDYNKFEVCLTGW